MLVETEMLPVVLGNADVGRHAGDVTPLERRHDRALRRMLLPLLTSVEQRIARLQPVRRVVVNGQVVRDRPNHSQLVGDGRMARHQVTDGQARQLGVDRRERPAHLGNRLRLHVDHVEMRRAARLKEKDHARRTSALGCLSRPRPQQIGERKPSHCEATHRQKASPPETTPLTLWLSDNVEHDRLHESKLTDTECSHRSLHRESQVRDAVENGLRGRPTA